MSMKTESRFVNRELSWLEFNQRVLDEAGDKSVPLLERLFFLTISASNLDEFCMVRVGGLELLRAGGVTRPDPAGLSPRRQLQEIHRRMKQMVCDQYTRYQEHLSPALDAAGLRRLPAEEVPTSGREACRRIFQEELLPVITPMLLRSSPPVPLIQNLELLIAVALEGRPGSSTSREYAAIPLSRGLNRVHSLSQNEGTSSFVLSEDIVMAFVQDLFPGRTILETAPFRITRNADIAFEEEFAEDLIAEMEKVLSRRKISACVRLELGGGASRELEAFLVEFLGVPESFVFRVHGPLDLSGLSPLVFLEKHSNLRYPPVVPQRSPMVEARTGLFDQITRRDILLSHPYESFDPVQQFVDAAADDPDVLAIKQVLYRTSRNSPVVSALRRAALNGKYVTAIVELRARFDEARNIAWARDLEAAGVQVIYGIRHLKIHAKICLIVRREPDGIARYVHFGTGNYNEKTARLYTDVGLFTRSPELGADASAFFNAVSGHSEPVPYLKLEQSPWRMRVKLIELITAEATRKRHGQTAGIRAKMNSLVDPAMIEALYEASQAGVEIQLNVRGICCLRPGVPGLSENIRVVSILDRFLEHSRIFCFHHGGTRKTFISSADWMTRNLSRRVELLVPVEDPECRKRLLEILEVCLADTIKARQILPDGTHRRVTPDAPAPPVRAQERLGELAKQRASRTTKIRRRVFEPHFSPEQSGGG